MTERVELDTEINKTTFVTSLHSEEGSGVTLRVIGKPNVSKGGQTVAILCEAYIIQPNHIIIDTILIKNLTDGLLQG